MQDRRLCIESGRPFLIQDANIQTRLPLDMTDAWLEQYKGSSAQLHQLAAEIEAEHSRAQCTTVPYFAAYISQNQIVTDVWKVLYSSKRSTSGTPNMNCEYLDTLLDNWWQTLPATLRYNDLIGYEEQFADMQWWQIKQCLALHLVCFVKTFVQT